MKTVAQIIGIALGVALLVLAVPVLMYFPGHNFSTVEKGSFYRSRQMSPKALEAAIKKHGIKTVVNLRGKNAGTPWYDEELEVCQRLGVTHESFGWSMSKLPDPESLAKFVALIESGPQPFLAHCEGGTHRAGVAAACYTLIKGADPETARKQFGPMFKDAPIGRVVDLYEGNPMPFKQWVLEEYPYLYESFNTSRATSQPSNSIALRPAQRAMAS